MWHETIGDRDLRPHYLPAFFVEAARRLGLNGTQDMLDLGCGMGAVLFAFAPYVRGLTGIDSELPSLRVVEAAARERGRRVRTVHALVEAADENLGPFDLITIGKAYWYMHSPATLARIDRWLKPGGRVLICAPTEKDDDGEVWQRTFFLLLDRWARAPRTLERELTPRQFFAGSAFTEVGRIDVHGEQTIDLEHLVRRAFGYHETSRARLGDAAGAMANDVRKIMRRFLKDGVIREKLHTGGVIFARRD